MPVIVLSMEIDAVRDQVVGVPHPVVVPTPSAWNRPCSIGTGPASLIWTPPTLVWLAHVTAPLLPSMPVTELPATVTVIDPKKSTVPLNCVARARLGVASATPNAASRIGTRLAPAIEPRLHLRTTARSFLLRGL